MHYFLQSIIRAGKYSIKGFHKIGDFAAEIHGTMKRMQSVNCLSSVHILVRLFVQATCIVNKQEAEE